MKKIHIVILLLLCLGCEKGLQYYDNTAAAAKIALPPYSQTGTNTFGFMMNNDSVWTVFGAKYFGTMFTPAQWFPNTVDVGDINPGFPDRSMFIVAGEFTEVKQNVMEKDYFAKMDFFPDTPFIRTYLLSGDLNNSITSGDFVFVKMQVDLVGFDEYFFIDSNKPFTLQVTRLDTLAKVSSGRFSGTLYTNPAYDSMVISEGRFDVSYH